MELNDFVIPIIIPAYEPDERLITLLKDMVKENVGPIIIVNDGSGDEYDSIFSEAQEIILDNKGVILSHKTNQGKGRALKTAFEYVIKNQNNLIGVVTADSDGQHTPNCISKVRDKLMTEPNNLILGVRCFDKEDIPWKSRIGNNITEIVFRYISGVHVTDTQTGLRGIPKKFMQELLFVEGERFEFEMRMLLEASKKYCITEVKIETVYDSVENHQTHFNPIKDSIKIYRILGASFIRFVFSSVSASVVDLILFTLLCYAIKDKSRDYYVIYATIGARVVSAIYNYLINYNLVFKSNENVIKSAVKYFGLAVVQMFCSAGLVYLLVSFAGIIPETIYKIVVDTFLFLISYKIQQAFVFKKNEH